VRSTQEAPRRFNIGSGELEARRLSTQVPLKSVNPAAPETNKKNDPVRTSSKRILRQAAVALIGIVTYLRDKFFELCFGRLSCRIGRGESASTHSAIRVSSFYPLGGIVSSIFSIASRIFSWLLSALPTVPVAVPRQIDVAVFASTKSTISVPSV